MFALMIVVFHISEKSSNNSGMLLKYGSIGVEYFFIVSGYFIAKKALNITKDCSNIGVETISYIFKKIKNFLPYTCIAYIMFIIVDLIFSNYSIKYYITSIWNVTFLDMSGVKTNYITGVTWYISAMLISMLILYPLMRKYKKNFTYIIAPLIVIFLGGWLSQKYGNLRSPWIWTGFAYKGLLRAFLELSLGAIIYEVAEKMKKIQFNKISKIILSIIEIVGFLSVFAIAHIGKSLKYDFVVLFILFISITIACSEKSILYNFANNKFFYYLEKLSLPIYLNHLWIIKLLVNRFNYLPTLILVIIFSFIVSNINIYIIENFISGKNLIKKYCTSEERN